MSGIENLIDEGVRSGMQLGTQAFASGGQVPSFAVGGMTSYRMFDDFGDFSDYYTPPPAAPAPLNVAPAPTQVSATTPVAQPQIPQQDWYDLGLMVEGGGNMQVPEWRKSDFAYYDAQGEPTIEVMTGGGDSGTSYETRANPNYRPAGYYLTPEAQARLGDQWTKTDSTSIAWGGNANTGKMMGGDSMGMSFSDFFNFAGGESAPYGLTTRPIYDPYNDGQITGYETGYYAGGGDNTVWTPWSATNSREAADQAFNDFWNQNSITANVKTADKGGTPVYWVRQGDRMVPVQLGSQFSVNTNNDHTIPAAAFASLGALAYAAPYVAAELGAAGTGGATAAGTSAAEAFALADSVYGAANLGYTAAELAALGGSAGTAAAAEAAMAQFGTTAADLAAQGATFNAATGVWSLPGYTVYGSAIPAVTAGEIAAGVGAAGTAAQLPTFESNYPTDVFEEGFTPSEANPVSGPDAPPPFEEGFIPSEANPVSGPTPSSFPSWEKALEWALKNPGQAAGIIGTIGSLIDDPNDSSGGGGGGGGGPSWQGPIPQYTAQQTVTQAPAGYRPGFSPEHVYLRTEFQGRPTGPATINVPGAGGGLPSIAPGAPVPTAPPLPSQQPYTGPAMIDPETAFTGTQYAGGGHVQGQGDGMSDDIPATIDGQQDAALSHDEFVVPADVVSDIGNGSSDAGAQVLYAMMDRIRQARHGTNKQPPEIDPAQFLPA